MKKTMRYQYGILLSLLVLIVVVATGCKQQTVAETTSSTAEAAVYTGALRADYENALDVTSQLALGVLRLEDTADAVTTEQATQMLPLWKTLQGTTVKTQAERLALTKQIEKLLSDTQIAAITAMQLTEAEAQTWLQEQGPMEGAQGGRMPGGGTGAPGNAQTMSEGDRIAMREQFQNMTEEQRAEIQAQFGQGGGGQAGRGNAPASGFAGETTGASTMLTRTVVTLLTERSGQVAVAVVTQPAEEETASNVEPAAAATSGAEPTSTPIARITLVPWSTPEPTPEPADAETATATDAPQNAAASTGMVQSVTQIQTETEEQPAALEWVPDTDPGPPLTVEITTNYAEANPNLEGGLIYNVGGFLYNPTDEVYAVTAAHVTFYDADGFRGAFYAFPRRPGQRGIRGEWHWHGAMEADVSCTVLGPEESCPFTAEIAAQNMASFHVHVDAFVTEWHESVSVTLSDSQIEDTGTGYVRISGTATNANVYPVKNVVISGLLLDDSGQIVSMGTGTVANIAAGESADFMVYVESKEYVSYRLTVRAEQDAK